MAAPTLPDIDVAPSAERGAVATEYALLASLIAIMIVGGVTVFGQAVSDMFTTAANFWP